MLDEVRQGAITHENDSSAVLRGGREYPPGGVSTPGHGEATEKGISFISPQE